MPITAQLFYSQSGAYNGSVPLVLIHGAGGSHLAWPPNVRRLPGRRVLAVDLPGHGGSAGPPSSRVEDLAAQVHAWAAALDLPPAVYAGHSLGGAVALQLALDFPQSVAGLALVSTSARLRVAPDFLELTAGPATHLAAVQAICARSFGPHTAPRLVELAAARMALTPPEVLHADLLACAGFDRRDRLAEVKQPALVLCGSLDQMTPLRHSEALAAALPDARLEVIEGAGHMLMLERPQEVGELIRKFLPGIFPCHPHQTRV